MKIRVVEYRMPDVWRVRVRRVHVPSTWPRGQSVMDRLYWIDSQLMQSNIGRAEYDRLSGLYDQALGLWTSNQTQPPTIARTR